MPSRCSPRTPWSSHWPTTARPACCGPRATRTTCTSSCRCASEARATHLARLQLRSFRNYARFDATLSPDVHLIVGDNAQGKSNLLEAVHYLSTLRSFRGTKPAELVRFGDDGARVEGQVQSEAGTDELAVAVQADGREATVNGKSPATIADYLRVLPSVTFTPDDILLLKGEGGPRRRALDRAVFGLMPVHFRHLLDYNRALKQKNALLKSGRAPDSELDTWDASLAEHGAHVLAGRHEFIGKVGPLLAEFFHDISGGQPKATLRYRGLAADAARLSEELAARRAEERMRGHTLVGPHRDDLGMEIGGRSVRRYASQGQHRMFALALKVAEIELHRRELGRHPVLLLDDVKSELDQDRVRYLFGFLDKIPAQLFVTATDFRELSGEIRRPTTIWTVRGGVATS